MERTLEDWEEAARRRLLPSIYDYYAGGGGQEKTLADNIAAYDRWRLGFRVLVDVSQRSLATTVLGTPVNLPVLIAPTAMQKMAHQQGEAATARAAQAVGTIMVASTLSNCSLEEIAEAAGGPKWFQLYVYRDRQLTLELLRRAEAAGFQALVLTVDSPSLGRRWRDMRNGFQMPAHLSLGNFQTPDKSLFPKGESGSGLAGYVAQQLDPGLTWKDVEWLRGQSRLPLLLKGIVRGEDAALAVEAGAAAIIVSNHGGRNLDSSPATLDALPRVVQAVGGRVEVLMDGGIRWGTDILKALCLGARAVLVGRPVLWGLAALGQTGVEEVLRGLGRDLDDSLALLGCPNVTDLSRDYLVEVAHGGR